MSGEPIAEEDLMVLFEAARWAPSSFNNQPWRILYARRDGEHWSLFLDLLVESNRVWARNAAALLLFISKTSFDHNGKPARTHSFDTGAAWENLALQATLHGYVVHGMQGFDYDRAKTALGIPEEYQVEAMVAVGKPGARDSLPEKLREIYAQIGEMEKTKVETKQYVEYSELAQWLVVPALATWNWRKRRLLKGYAIGALGYVSCAEEILSQTHEMDIRIDHIVCASGSTGTHAGLICGLVGNNSHIPLTGINVRRTREEQEPNVHKLAQETAALLGIPGGIPREAITALGDWVGPGYSLPTPEMVEAVQTLARVEGILLDPVYTGKAMAGLIGLVRAGRFRKGEHVLFVHTGGSPALYAYQDVLVAQDGGA